MNKILIKKIKEIKKREISEVNNHSEFKWNCRQTRTLSRVMKM